MIPRSFVALSFLAVPLFAACNKAPAEPTERPAAARSTAAPDAAFGSGQGGGGGGNSNQNVAATARRAAERAAALSGDPQGGKPFTLADAAPDLATQKGDWLAELRTSKGNLVCKLYEDKAPNTVANFIGLATGTRAWKEPSSGEWVKRPAYDGTVFHRIVSGFMIQGGDPKGNGSGEPGYTIDDEIWEGAKHDRAGLLCMANRGPHTNGAQFFITDGSTPHLDGGYTIFGECTPTTLVSEIAKGPSQGDRALSPVVIEAVQIKRSDAN